MHRLGVALIAIGLILLASPLYMPAGATIYLIDPNDVWNRPVSPGGSPQQPEVIVTQATALSFTGSFTRAASNWYLPGSCSNYKVYARVYDGSNLVKTVTWDGSLLTSMEGGNVCDMVVQSVPISGNFQNDKVYVVKWQLEVRDSSGSLIGYVDKPSDTAFVIRNVPSVKWYINNQEVSPSSTILATPPITFKMVVVSGDASMISAVKVKIMRGTTELAHITLSKTGTSTWETTWNTTEKGKVTVGGYFVIDSVEYFTLSIMLDLGGGGGGGGRFFGLTPLQLLGLICLLSGFGMVVMRRD